MTTTATISTIPTAPAPAADELGSGVPLLDRLAMRIGLALLLWGRHHADARRAPLPERPALIADARWYLR